MSYNPIANSQGYSHIRNTETTPNSIFKAQQSGRLSQEREIQGWVDSKAPDNAGQIHYHDLMDNEGNFIEFTPGMVISSVTYGAVPFGTLAGGIDVLLTLSSVPVSSSSFNSATVDFVTNLASLADINKNVYKLGSTQEGITKTYPVVRVNGTFTQQTLADGTMYYPKIAVVVNYIDTQDVNITGLPGPHQYPSSGTVVAYNPFVSASALTPGSK